jgi:hypothetical protein
MAIHRAMYEELQRVAQRRALTTYGDVAPLVGIPRITPATIGKLGQALDDIARHEHRAGRPLLAVLVVRKGTGTPGPGFYTLAQELGLLPRDHDEATRQRFFEEERHRVYDAWQ